ncbi:MAG: hypothetical protein ACO307_17395 [Ilumatobacteraceae bacterium]|jgi:hypothetical protein
MAGETILLGRNVTYTGISNVREGSITTTFTEVDKTKVGDTERLFVRGWAEQTAEFTCVDLPGVNEGSVVTLSASGANGHNLSSVKFLVTNVTQNEPLDDIITYTVSATRGVQ